MACVDDLHTNDINYNIIMQLHWLDKEYIICYSIGATLWT